MSAKLDDIVYGEVAASISSYFERHGKFGDTAISGAADIADVFVDRFLTVTTVDDERLLRRFNVVNISADGSAYSQRLGNIFINWRRVLQDAPGIALTGVGAAGSVALLLLAAAAISIQLHGHTKVALAPAHVAVLKAVIANSQGDPPSIDAEAIPSLCLAEGFEETTIQSAIDQLCGFSIARLENGILTLEQKIAIGA